ncbi:MAG: radical SAM family heme chaperone HemW [Bacillota bacterium]|nr:radical SAM family heme chaperone HemW [Bacillota bacterium]
MNKEADALYVHIPFCSAICGYCDFSKLLYDRGFAFSYLQALKKEIESYRIGRVKTIYVGGGTPTSLDDDLFSDLLSFLAPFLDENGEYSVEANPESLSPAKAKMMAEAGVNRVSMGVESADPALLKLMGRRHDNEMVKKAISNLKEVGIDNYNLDLIYGLPGEGMETLNNDVDFLLSLNPPHLSLYSLTVSPGSIFYNRKLPEAPEDLSAGMYEYILKRLRASGYRRYEVSNFAKPGFESRHNLTYWRDEPYYGCGLAASGYLGDIRYQNVKNLSKYLAGEYVAEREKVDEGSAFEYYLLTNLRLEEGFSLKDFESRFGVGFLEKYPEANKLFDEGLLILKDERIMPSDRGIMILDRVLLRLF